MSRRTPTLKDRAELYAEKHARQPRSVFDSAPELRPQVAKAWLDGYQAAMRRRHAKRSSP